MISSAILMPILSRLQAAKRSDSSSVDLSDEIIVRSLESLKSGTRVIISLLGIVMLLMAIAANL